MDVRFQRIALIFIAAAQLYAIIRFEVLLRRERALHDKIEGHLGTLTPAGLWPQYENLKKFYDRLVEEVLTVRR
jgi:hypothetical protein